MAAHTLEQSDEERPPLWPAAGGCIVVRKDKLARATGVGHCEQRHQNNDDTCGGPVDADLVDDVQVARAEGVDEGAHKHNGPEAQDGLPFICDKVFIEDGDGTEDQLRAGEIDGQGDGPIADQRQPAVDEADDGGVLGRAQHGGPVVDTAGGREDGADLGERGGDAERDEGDEDPAVQDGDGLAVGEGDVEGRRQAKRHGHDGE